LDRGVVSIEIRWFTGGPCMFLPGKRKGASFVIMVIIMALVMSTYAISVSQMSRSRSSTLISDATEKQVLYLAEDAANQMIYKLNTGDSSPIGSPTLVPAPELGNSNYKYEASYDTANKPYYPGTSSGTVVGKAYLMNPSYPTDTSKAVYSKTVYLEVVSASASPLMVYVVPTGGLENTPYYRIWNGTAWGSQQAAPAVSGGMFQGVNSPHIEFITLSFDPGSTHAMLGMEDTYGNFWAEEWNGSQFSSAYLVFDSGGNITRAMHTRSFDIAYENTATSGVNRALFVFEDGNKTVDEPLYSIWDGSVWQGNGLIGNHTRVRTVPSTMTEPYFIETATNPTTGSKGIGMIYQDASKRVFGEVWDGTSWSTMGQSSSWGTANSSTGRTVSIAYVQTTGNLLFGYGNGAYGYSRFWNGTTLATAVALTANNMTVQWMEFDAIPGTSVVLAFYETNATTAYQLYSSTFTTTAWSGTRTSLGALYHDYVSTYFGFASTGTSLGTVFYSTDSSALGKRTWSGGGTWAAATTTGSWTRSYAEVAASSTSGNTLSAFYEGIANNDVIEWHTNTAGVWQTMSNVSTGVTLNPPYERVAIAIPVASGGAGFSGVKGTWRESY
jgi:hypothetical protein